MKKLLCLLCVALLFSCCDGLDFGKSESGYLDYLPKKTQEGANTFGCYINGELAASKSYPKREGIRSSMLGPSGFVNGYWGIYSDTIMSFDIRTKQASLVMGFESLHRGVYECEVSIKFRDNPDSYGRAFKTVSITKLDRSNHIISGEFDSLDIPLYNYKDSVVHLRKVRFDIKYGSDF